MRGPFGSLEELFTAQTVSLLSDTRKAGITCGLFNRQRPLKGEGGLTISGHCRWVKFSMQVYKEEKGSEESRDRG